ncbi:MAG: DEAD/DEAH box helicase, partial [Pseudomonadales bacterium]
MAGQYTRKLSPDGAVALLADAYKDRIQRAYSAWLDARGFRGRRGQRSMIADIARTFAGASDVEDRSSGEHICVVEAGTGTGKTVAYLIPAIAIAQALDKKLVVATATVNLQEQLVLRDLPDIARNSGLQFEAALAKGRGRYVCLDRLDRHMRNTSIEASELQLFEEEALSDDRRQLFSKMLAGVADGHWRGDRDSWSEELSDESWTQATTDHRACSGPRCGFFRQCPFFLAREELQDVDVIVANHDLVLADLTLGGGVVLPAPEESIYIFDEGHNLADKALGHFRYSSRLHGTARWLERLGGFVGTMVQRLHRPPELEGPALEMAQALPGLSERLTTLGSRLEEELPFQTQGDGRLRC